MLVNERERHLQNLNERKEVLSKISSENKDQIKTLDI